MELTYDNIVSFIVRFGSLGILLLVVILVLIYWHQNKLLYIPESTAAGILRDQDSNPPGFRNPGEKYLIYEDVYIKTADNITLHGWFIKQPPSLLSMTNTVVYFHENAGNIGTRMDFITHYTNRLRVNLLLVAYRGYSKSEGIPTEEGLKLDSEAILKYIFNQRTDIDKTKIFIHGRSLGGAVSIYIATHTQHQIAGVILENTFTSISDMVDTIFPKLSFFKRFIQRNFWPSVERIGKIRQPLMFIIALKDEIVPANQMAILEAKASNAIFKSKHIIPNGLHNSSWTESPTEYFDAIAKFMTQALLHSKK